MADRGGSDKPSLRRRTGGSASRGHGCGSSSPAYANKNESPHRAGKIGEGGLQVDGMRPRMPSGVTPRTRGAVKQRRRVPASSYYGQSAGFLRLAGRHHEPACQARHGCDEESHSDGVSVQSSLRLNRWTVRAFARSTAPRANPGGSLFGFAGTPSRSLFSDEGSGACSANLAAHRRSNLLSRSRGIELMTVTPMPPSTSSFPEPCV